MTIRIGVYKFTCEPTGRFYIGSSENIDKRKKRHLSGLRNGEHHNIFFQRVFDKYDEDSFTFQVILTDTLEEARSFEQVLIDKHLPKAKMLQLDFDFVRKGEGMENIAMRKIIYHPDFSIEVR